MTKKPTNYYVPDRSYWPIIGSIGLFLFSIGAASWFQGKIYGPYIFFTGSLILSGMMYGWFSNVIQESMGNLYSQQIDRSFRWGMFWFIVSEFMFFLAFFGTLFYARQFSVPWLSGESNNTATHEFLWSNFIADWPLLNNPDPEKFIGPKTYMHAWPLPTINTLLLLTSSVTITVAHHALKDNKRVILNIFLGLTLFLAISFLACQVYEYYEAYTELGLKLNSGIYGTTFFMLTGFHGLHVTIGSIMIFFILIRCFRGHFNEHNHFAFEATAWYWHFVDVVWLFLYLFVYILPIK